MQHKDGGYTLVVLSQSQYSHIPNSKLLLLLIFPLCRRTRPWRCSCLRQQPRCPAGSRLTALPRTCMLSNNIQVILASWSWLYLFLPRLHRRLVYLLVGRIMQKILNFVEKKRWHTGQGEMIWFCWKSGLRYVRDKNTVWVIHLSVNVIRTRTVLRLGCGRVKSCNTGHVLSDINLFNSITKVDCGALVELCALLSALLVDSEWICWWKKW